MQNMFSQLSEKFQTGTINLSVQIDNGVMAVMVTFKGIDVPPRVLKGSPAEIDQSFFENLGGQIEMVSAFNKQAQEIELKKALDAQLKKAEEEANPPVKKAEKPKAAPKEKPEPVQTESQKKLKELEAKMEQQKAAQVSMVLDPAPLPVVEAPVIAAPIAQPIVPDVTAAPVFEMPFATVQESKTALTLTESELDYIITEMKKSELMVWDLIVFGQKLIAQIKGCSEQEAEILFSEHKLSSLTNKPEPEVEQNHQANVEALKRDLAQPVIPPVPNVQPAAMPFFSL